MNITVEHPHIYLYAKYWYKQSDIIQDLQRLIAHEVNIDQEYINIDIIVNILITLTVKEIISDLYPINKLTQLLDHITTKTHKINCKPSDDSRIITIKACLSTLRESINTTLPEPDYSILPKDKK